MREIVDPLEGDIEQVGGAKPGFPIIADEGLAVSKAFDMLPAEAYMPDGRTPADSATVRSVFIIGPDKQLKLSMTYPMHRNSVPSSSPSLNQRKEVPHRNHSRMLNLKLRRSRMTSMLLA